MKKLLSLFLVAMMILSLAACGEKTSGEENDPSGSADSVYAEEATVGITWKITDYNPSSNAINVVNDLVFDSLIYYNRVDKKLEPSLATEWEWVGDGYKVLRLKLREGVTFHNGNPFTAEDVEFSLARISNANIAGYYDHCEIEGDYSVDIHLSSGNADFPYLLTNMLYAGIGDKESCEADPDEGVAIGTGPWAYDLDNVVEGNSWQFTRNDNYWGEVPVTKRLTLRHISDPTSRMIALQNKEIAAYMEVGVTNIASVKSDSKLVYCNGVGVGAAKLYFLAFNMARGKAADNVYLRQAVACAINKADVIAAYGDPEAVESDGAFWGFDTPYRASKSDFKEDLSYSVERAKELVELAKKDAGGELPTLKLMAVNNDLYMSMALAIQAQCKDVGIKVEIMETDAAGFESMTKFANPGDHDMSVYSVPLESWASAASRTVIHGSNSNRATLDSDYITNLMKESSSVDEKTREKNYIAVQTYVHDEAIYVPLYYGSRDGAQLAETDGIIWANDGYPDFTYIRVLAGGSKTGK